MSKPFKTFENLKVWQKARAIRVSITKIVKSFPGSEKYKLSDQMTRYARSVTANIAEGYGRYHFQENIQYCRQARGSLYELLDHLICAKDEKLINNEQYHNLRSEIEQNIKMINGYIAYLKKQKSQK